VGQQPRRAVPGNFVTAMIVHADLQQRRLRQGRPVRWRPWDRPPSPLPFRRTPATTDKKVGGPAKLGCRPGNIEVCNGQSMRGFDAPRPRWTAAGAPPARQRHRQKAAGPALADRRTAGHERAEVVADSTTWPAYNASRVIGQTWW